MKVYDVFVRYNDGGKEIAEEMYESKSSPNITEGVLAILTGPTEGLYIPLTKIYSFTITERDIT